jgi:predicted nucleotidyltransferase
VSPGPTHFADLNDVLLDLVRGAQAALAGKLLGLYLVGSFALGAGDEHSDVDFLAVVDEEPTADDERRLRTLHRELPDRAVHWAQHLEGSYAPAADLRLVHVEPSPWLYVDNGSREMERSTHDNSAIVRRTVREHGIVLAGAHPRSLVASVDARDLALESKRLAHEYHAWLADDWARLDNGWRQPYQVATFCRMLATITLGDVLSKAAALEWGLRSLEPEWHELIAQALIDRPDPAGRYRKPARPELLESTRRFIEYAVARADELVGEPGFEPGTGRI